MSKNNNCFFSPKSSSLKHSRNKIFRVPALWCQCLGATPPPKKNSCFLGGIFWGPLSLIADGFFRPLKKSLVFQSPPKRPWLLGKQGNNLRKKTVQSEITSSSLNQNTHILRIHDVFFHLSPRNISEHSP